MILPSYITDYLLGKFQGEGKVVSEGRELIIPSIFLKNDYKCHMSINLTTGLWQCFKTKNKGNFYQLYAALEHTTYSKAKSKAMVHAYLNEPKKPIIHKTTHITDFTEELEGASPVDMSFLDRPGSALFKAQSMIRARGLDGCDLLLMDNSDSRYNKRLIIPYKNPEGEIIFFQGRSLYDTQKPKYLNANSCKASNILFPYEEDASFLIITEGPIDCLTLKKCGLNATCINGSLVSHVQTEMLKTFPGKIIMSLDNDEAGQEGVKKFERMRKKKMMPEFAVCYPPEPFKDWNDAWVNGVNIPEWIHTNKPTPFSWDYQVLTELQDATAHS